MTTKVVSSIRAHGEVHTINPELLSSQVHLEAQPKGVQATEGC